MCAACLADVCAQAVSYQCRPAILFLAFVIDAAFALAIMGFLIMHCRMIARNMTTIEMYEKRRYATGPWPFDQGAKQNFLEVFGRRYGNFPWLLVKVRDEQRYP